MEWNSFNRFEEMLKKRQKERKSFLDLTTLIQGLDWRDVV
jgi:hypothetical protein